jgi:uncharacterized protein (TIGR02996 family)
MDQAQAFLQAIREDPDDDTPRLILADWWEDQHQSERAAFLRAQVRLASLPEYDPAYPELEDEADDLLARHEEQWAAAVNPIALEWQWHRGFIEQVTLSAEAFVEQGEELLASAPIRRVRILGGPAELRLFAQCPHANALSHLDLAKGTWSESAFRVGWFRDADLLPLATSPWLRQLRSLDLAGQGIEGPFLRALVESGLFDRLERLELGGNQPLGDRALRTLAEARASRFVELGLRSTNITAHGLREIFQSRNSARAHQQAESWPRLRWFRALGGGLLRMNHALTILREMRETPLVRRLSNLDLAWGGGASSPISVDLVTELAQGSLLEGVTELDLTNSELRSEGAEVLVRSPHLGQLARLELSYGRLGSQGGEVLSNATTLGGLRHLGLASNHFGDEGVRALASGPLLGHLTRIDLEDNGIAGPGCKALFRVPVPVLRRLSLAGNDFGRYGPELLAGSSWPERLTWLDLSGCNLGPAGARALAECPGFRRLRVLRLAHCRLGDEGVRALADSPHLARLRELSLDSNDLYSPAAQALLDSPWLNRVRRLGLRGSYFTSNEKEQLRARFGEGVVF